MQSKNHQESSEQIQALTNCNQHLNFIASIIKNDLIAESKKSQIIQQIEKIKNRSQEQNLSLAVVGEFSSGKSTFINALLRDDILKTSALVATAVATKITSEQNLSVEATLKGKKKGIVKTNPRSNNISIPFLNIHNVTHHQLIHLLTAEDSIAQNVTDLTICHPARFLQEGINIIDTPGTNAVNVEHGKITRNVIENLADVAVIIIPATTPLSQTLANFLDTALRPFLHRCVFVVTKIDCIRKRDRESLMKNLQHRLETMLGIKNPDLFAVAPQMIIDSFEEDEITADNVIWISQFTNLEHFLQSKLRRERLLIIAESLLRLLTKTLEELTINLTEEWQKYQQYQLVLKQNTIQDLESFTKAKKQQYLPKLKQATEQINNNLYQFIGELHQKFRQIINQQIMAISDWQELNSVIENYVEPLLNSYQNVVQQKLAEELLVLNKFAQFNQDSFDQEFIQAYEKLQALGGNSSLAKTSNQQQALARTPAIIENIKKTRDQQENEATGRVVKGVVIGIVGAILLPGFGAVIGAIAGGYLSRLFGPSLEERKNELWDELESNLNGYFQQINQQLQREVNEYGQNLITNLESHINLYMDKYQQVVNSMLNEQQIDLNRLQSLQEKTQNYLHEIERCKQQIEQQTNRLINIMEA